MNTPIFYTVTYTSYDGVRSTPDYLGSVRRGYLGTFLRDRGKISDTENGLPIQIRYRIGKKSFAWEKKSGALILEKAHSEKDGYTLLKWNVNGVLVSKAAFDFGHRWLQTSYYRDSPTPQALLKPTKDGKGLWLCERCEQGETYRETQLEPCALGGSAAQQSLLHSMIGEPLIVADTSAGMFCYCTQEEAARRNAVLNELRNGTLSTQITWPAQQEEEEVGFSFVQNIEAEDAPLEPALAVLEEKPASKKKEEEKPAALSRDYTVNRELFVLDGMPDKPARYAVAVKSLEGLVCAPRLIQVADKAAQPAVRQLEDMAREPQEESELLEPAHENLFEALNQDHDGGSNDVPFVPYLLTQEDRDPSPVSDVEPKEQEEEAEDLRLRLEAGDAAQPDLELAQREEEVGKLLLSLEAQTAAQPDLEPAQKEEEAQEPFLRLEEEPAAQPDPGPAEKEEEAQDPLLRLEEEPAAQPDLGPAEKEEEAQDPLLRLEEEPTAQPDPQPAEKEEAGEDEKKKLPFSENLDSEECLYEESTLRPAKRIVISVQESYLYFGNLINGLREGTGRTQMANGHTAYEGGYRAGKRDGFGVYYYKSGKLCYAGDWKQNRRDGLGVSYSSRDGSIFLGRWKDNIPTGSGSAFDAQGNLLYTGMWRGGLRDGYGTQYQDGKIVYTGQWRCDRYNGYGTLTLADGSTVSGYFQDGKLPPVE